MQKLLFKTTHFHWFRSALLFFIIAAILGLMMRFIQFGDLPNWIDFRKIRHAHSHVALLGWLYAGLYILIAVVYKLHQKIYGRIFWLSQLTVLGMLISFPIQGYKAFSIVFLTLFIFLTYFFIILVIRDIRKQEKEASLPFLWTSLFFLFLSSLGTWSLAIMMANSMKGSALYYGAIQFYLHFQFNGWLIFGLLAIFFKFLHNYKIEVDNKKVQSFYFILLIATLLTFALAITWSTPLPFIFWINSLGVLTQLIALGYFILLLKKLIPILKKLLSKEVLYLLFFSALSLVIKVIIQTCVAIPAIAIISYTIRYFVIGFIHLLMLGCISLFIIGMIQHFNEKNRKLSLGLSIFVIGILVSELLLFLQGVFLWTGLGFFNYYYELLFAFSALLPIGLIGYIISLDKKRFSN